MMSGKHEMQIMGLNEGECSKFAGTARPAAAVVLEVFPGGCGGSGEPVSAETGPDTLDIISRTAIGAEECDAGGGFAEVASVCHAPDSSLLVVDKRMANVRPFSPTGSSPSTGTWPCRVRVRVRVGPARPDRAGTPSADASFATGPVLAEDPHQPLPAGGDGAL